MDGMNAIIAERDGTVVRVTASDPGAIRVELFPSGAAAPEPASWAVLPEWWSREIEVERTGPQAFRTDLLDVSLDAGTLSLTIADRNGRMLVRGHARDPVRSDTPGFRLRLEAPAETRYYGLGDKPDGIEKRGRAYTMWNSDRYGFGESWDPLYKTVPFLLAVDREGVAAGLFVDCTYRTGFDLAATEPDVLAIAAPSPSLRYHVIAGPHPKAVLERFTALVGRASLPPIWSLGYGQCRYSYDSAARAIEVVRQHRARSIPLDAIWLDIGYQDRNRPYTTNPDTYPVLADLVDDAASLGVRVVVIADLHVPSLPGEPYPPYEGGIEGDHFVRTADGSTYTGEVWPGPCHFPDFTRSVTRDWWGTLAARFVADGVGGFWNDMNEPAVFDGPGKTMPTDLRHRVEEPGFATRSASHEEIHNVFGMQNARATHDGLLALRPDRRPYVMTRAGYAGTQRYAVTWTGDNTSSWNHLRLSTPQLLSLGLSGFGLAGCDIGGFKGSPSPELLTQWIATGVFNPLFRNHTDLGSRDQEAWVHGPEHETIRRRAIETRYRLMPYIYTAIEEMTRTGIPIMRPMFLEFPDPALASVDTRFMFGHALMVAPPPDETLDDHVVAFPAGTDWFSLWSGRKIIPDAERQMALGKRIGFVPAFVRAGSIIPMGKPVDSLAARRGALRLHIYPGPDADGSVYDDDGETFAYRQGRYHRQRFRYEEGVVTAGIPEGQVAPYWRRIRVILHGQATPRPVRDEGGQAIETVHDPMAQTLRFRIPAGPGRYRVEGASGLDPATAPGRA